MTLTQAQTDSLHKEGAKAFSRGKPKNPYGNSPEGKEWAKGYYQALTKGDGVILPFCTTTFQEFMSGVPIAGVSVIQTNNSHKD